MGSSLRDIPGAGGGKRKRGLGSVGVGPAAKPWRPPPKITNPSKGKRTAPALRFQGPRFEVDRFNLALGIAFLVLFVVGGIWLLRANSVSISSGEFGDGDAVRTREVARLAIEVHVDPADRAGSATVTLDGEDVTDDVEETDDGFIWHGPDDGLDEGHYELGVEVPRAVFGTESWTMTFGVDDTPPTLDIPVPGGVGIGESLTIAGEVNEPVDLVAQGEPVDVDEDGHFEVTFDTPPAGMARFVATDPAGNSTTVPVPITVAPPSTRGAHLSADAWADDALREGVLTLLDDGQIDSVVLDVKDECGIVTYGTELDLPAQVGAVDERYDLGDAVDTVHDHGGQVVARLVTFRDPLLARWAWANAHPDWVLQDTAHDPWPAYGDGEGCPAAENAPPIVGGFTNFASRQVWNYNLAIAEEVADLGVDNVLLDDVRRPDGDLANMLAVGLEGTNVATLNNFLEDAHERVRAKGVYLGATTAGISVRDEAVYDQDLSEMGAAVDYLSPEVYPESYSAGFFNLPDPQAQPGAAVEGALNEVKDKLGDLGTPLVPWLQDYSSAVTYGPTEVQAQVDGAARAGSCSWIMRDPEFTYTAGISAGSC